MISAVAGLIGGTLFAASAQASASQPDPSRVATTMAHQLGSRTAGSYLDRATNRLVVTVTSESDAATVRGAGAVPRMVARSGAQLQQAMTTLSRTTTKVPGTAWSIDPATDQVLLQADSSVTGSRLARVTSAARQLGSAVRVQRVAGRFSTMLSGGDAIFGGNVRCSAGFNVTDGTNFFMITAGHCGNVASQWFTNSSHTTLIGPTLSSSFPGNDYAIVQYTGSVSHPGTVGSQDITQAGNAFVGESVQRRGSTTGLHSGTVQATNVSVNFGPDGIVNGEVQTTVCAEPGDSGGPLFSGGTALATLSGGSGDCNTGGTTFYQPVTEPLGVFGVRVF
jgi:streptogrisin D